VEILQKYVNKALPHLCDDINCITKWQWYKSQFRIADKHRFTRLKRSIRIAEIELQNAVLRRTTLALKNDSGLLNKAEFYEMLWRLRLAQRKRRLNELLQQRGRQTKE
jgi:hypothetical protein